MNDLPDLEKAKLAHEAIAAFADQFQPLDKTGLMFVAVILELLYNSKKPVAYYDEISKQYVQRR